MNIVVKSVSVGLLALVAGGCGSSPPRGTPQPGDYDELVQLMGEPSISENQRKAVARVLSWNLTGNLDLDAVDSLVRGSTDTRYFCDFVPANGNGCSDFEPQEKKPLGDNSGDVLPSTPPVVPVYISVGVECGEILGRILEFPRRRGQFDFIEVKYGNSWVTWWAANQNRTPEEWRAEVRQFAREHHEEDER